MAIHSNNISNRSWSNIENTDALASKWATLLACLLINLTKKFEEEMSLLQWFIITPNFVNFSLEDNNSSTTPLLSTSKRTSLKPSSTTHWMGIQRKQVPAGHSRVILPQLLVFGLPKTPQDHNKLSSFKNFLTCTTFF